MYKQKVFDKMVWQDIEGYEGLYQVSDLGEVRGVDRYVDLPRGKKRLVKGRILKQRINNYGYLDVRLSKKSTTKTFFVHRLVASAFIPNPDNKPQVNHLGLKSQNTPDLLEWTDASGNVKHAYETGLNKNCGCNHKFAVAVIDVITGEIYCTQKAFSEHFGIKYSSAKNALNGIQPFPKYVDLSGHSFEKYIC